MLKQLFTGLSTVILAAANLPLGSATAASNPIVIDNLSDLCETMLADGNWLDDTGTCHAYTKTQTSATINRYIYVTGNWVFKDLDLTFTRSNSPFIINGGSLAINGGTYSSPSCVVWIQYNNLSTPGYYVPITTITINSGTFEASVETTYSAESPSPVCLITPATVTTDEAQDIINNYLPNGKKFVDAAPKLRTRAVRSTTTDSLGTDTGYAHISKDASLRDEVKYLKTTRVAVVGEPTPEPAPEPESTTEEPTPEPTPTEPTSETPKETPTTPVIPKAPNTGAK